MQNFFSKYSLKVMGMLLIFYIGMILGALLCYWKGEASLTVLEESMWDILISIAVGIITSILFNLIMWFWQFHKIPENLKAHLEKVLDSKLNPITSSLNPNTASLKAEHESIRKQISAQSGQIYTIYAEIDEQKSLRRNNAGSKIEKLDQDVQNAVREFADLKETVSKLQEQLQEFQQENMQLQTENEELNSQLQEMQSQGMDMA